MTFPIVARWAVVCCAMVVAFAFAATPLFAITIDGESRLTEEQFAKKNGKPVSEVKKTFAASGTLECIGGRMRRKQTAQLVGKKDIVVTAAHVFFEEKTCRPATRPSQCTFKTHDGMRAVSRSVQLVAIGDYRCKTDTAKIADWVVLKLSAPITTISPYDVSEQKEIVGGASILSVSAQSQDFYLNGRLNQAIKTIDDCQIKNFTVLQAESLMSTNCDTAPGNSGGALLTKAGQGRQRLLAITIASSKGKAGAKPRHAPQDGPYRYRTWSSLAVPLTGEFRLALETATGRPLSPLWYFPGKVLVGQPAADKPAAAPVSSSPCDKATAPDDCPKP